MSRHFHTEPDKKRGWGDGHFQAEKAQEKECEMMPSGLPVRHFLHYGVMKDNQDMSNYFEYQANGDKVTEKPQPREVVVQDQDTVIGDAMCEAAQLFYDCANQIAQCISDNAQCAIDMRLLHQAEIALAYMQGVDFGLAMDDKLMKWYLVEMEKSMASIRDSKDLAFQPQVYVPPAPAALLGFDEFKARNHNFLHCLSTRAPSPEREQWAREEMFEDKLLKQRLQKIAEERYPELFDIFKELDRPPPKGAEDNPPPAPKEKVAEDDSPSVTNLRNLFRAGRIDKAQYVGSLATLYATGLINNGQFLRLKKAAN